MTAKNKTAIQAEIDSLITTNGTFDVSASDVRKVLETAKDSNLNTQETSNQTIASKLNSATINSDQMRMGIIDYNDAATATTPISVTGGGGYTDITNDGLGGSTNKTYRASGVSELWDVSTNLFDWSDLSLGDTVLIRLDVKVTTTSANQTVDTKLLLGVGGSPYSLMHSEKQFKTAGAHEIDKFAFMVYMGNTNTLNNGAKFQIQSDGNCTVEVRGFAIEHHLRG